MKRVFFGLAVALLALSSLTISACGGGGGGGESFVGAAVVSISDQPSTIDSGGRTKVTTEIGDVHENGISLKFRFPKGLSFVRDSAILEVDGQQVALDPSYVESSTSYKYAVFFLAQSAAGRNNFARLTFELRGDAEVEEGRIEIDADVDDLDPTRRHKFNVEEPEFSPEDEANIEVKA